MIPAEETFGGTFPFKPHFTNAPGFKMHYVDEGEGDIIICLHGEPTWGYLYRNFIPKLSQHYRVIVPDHMGFGKSETPQDREYTFKAHVENLTAFVEDLGLTEITFVIQDWGGPLAGSFALRNPDKVKRFCLMNTMLGYGGAVRDIPKSATEVPKLHESPWFTWVRKTYADGTYQAVMQHIGDNVLSVMKKLYFHNSAAIDEQWMRAYSMPFATVEESKAAIEFPLDVVLDRVSAYVVEGVKMGNLEKVRSKPAMLAEGMLDKAMPPAMVMDDFRRLFPNGAIVEIENAGHFCQEDVPETLVALIEQFIQMTD
ncbi:MAG: alpha/beta fold hydrolase [Saprospiraceae bacterium]|nr:alpha/beta fold hydrolase [Saprospiraceae bacterium]